MNPRPTGQSRQIADDLRTDILSGRIPPGMKLPVNREIARRYGVSRPTVERAMSLLEDEGLVTAQQGSGTYVRQLHQIRWLGPDRYARSRWQTTTVDVFTDDNGDKIEQHGGQTQTVELVPAGDRVAAAFGIDAETPVWRRARVVTREGMPTHTMTSWYPPDSIDGTPLTNPRPGIAGDRSGFQILTDQGLAPHRITEELFARMPTAEEMTVLDLHRGEPVVELRRTTRTADGTVCEYGRGVHVASRFAWRFTYDIPD